VNGVTASAPLPFEMPHEMPPPLTPLILKRGELDEIRVSRVRYRSLEWTAFQRWELNPGIGWNLATTVALQPDEWTAIMAEFAPRDSRKKQSR
jgi:hypothetical protein